MATLGEFYLETFKCLFCSCWLIVLFISSILCWRLIGNFFICNVVCWRVLYSAIYSHGTINFCFFKIEVLLFSYRMCSHLEVLCHYHKINQPLYLFSVILDSIFYPFIFMLFVKFKIFFFWAAYFLSFVITSVLERTAYKNKFSSSTMCFPGIQIRFVRLEDKSLYLWAISLALF